jgi:WD40 repeat protein
VDLATGQLQLSFLGEMDKEYPLVRAMSFSPDGHWLAVGGNEGNVKLFEATSGRLAKTMRGHVDWVTAVAFSRDGRLVSGSEDQTVRVWSTETATALRILKGRTGFVTGVAFSPDGLRVSATGYEGTVKVWEANTGALVWSAGHPEPANAVAFSPDGRVVASASDDDTIKLWDAGNGAAKQHVGNDCQSHCRKQQFQSIDSAVNDELIDHVQNRSDKEDLSNVLPSLVQQLAAVGRVPE